MSTAVVMPTGLLDQVVTSPPFQMLQSAHPFVERRFGNHFGYNQQAISFFETHILPWVDPLRGSSGAITGFAHVMSEITDRKQAEVALTEEKERFRVLVAEDDEALRKLAERILASAGYNVLKAANCGEALLNESLRKREAELEMRTRELGEVNTALKILLRKGEEDQAALGETMLANVRGVVGPHLERLKHSPLSDEQVRYLQIIESNIRDIVSPFVKEISSAYLGLSPAEIQVANLIKQGKTTKEVAAVLNLSINTVMSHRFKIRSKLGLIKNKMNLHSFLRSIR